MIRRILAAALAGLLLFTITACKGSDDTPDSASAGNGGSNVQQTSSHNPGNTEDQPDDEFVFDDDDDGEFIMIEDIPSLAWMYEDDDPADLRLSLRRDDQPPAGVSQPDGSTAVGDLVWFGALCWKVLEIKNDKALLVCDKLVDFRPYRYDEMEPNTWETSGVRDWLNGAFYNGTFTDEEMALIVETKLYNDDNPWFDTEGGEDTMDNVFLLSVEDVVRCFGDSGKLGNHTDRDVWIIFDDYNNERVAEYIDSDYITWWWLRSPGMNFQYTATVSIDGSINVSGDYVLGGGGGVRPAIWVLL